MKGLVFLLVAALLAPLNADIVSGRASMAVRSRFVDRGLVKGKDPVIVPAGSVSFGDWIYLDIFAIYDVTKGNGKRGGYGNRAGKYRKYNTSAGLRHGFDLGECLGTLVADVGYMYEYVHRHHGAVCDTQFLNARFSLPDLWLEPSIWIERDIMLDDGTYAYCELGHTFNIGSGFSIRPAVGQGAGDRRRSAAFGLADFERGGMMDSTVRIDLTYTVTSWLTLGAYVAYHDYLFDSRMRDAAARANGAWGSGLDRSWLFSGGISAVVTF